MTSSCLAARATERLSNKMLFFGHIGITGALFAAYDAAVSMVKTDAAPEMDSSLKPDTVVGNRGWLQNRIGRRLGLMDYRIVLLGSLLPDVIDKPVWLIATRVTDDVSLSGRDYAHTLLLNLVLLIGGVVLMRYRKSWLLVLALASFTHLMFDRIWSSPAVLLWPLSGPLAKGETAGWVSGMAQGLFSYPGVYVPETIGLVVLLLFAYRLVVRKRVVGFIRDGVVG